MLSFYEDGYTAAGYIEGRPGLYTSLRFEYRPFLIVERTALMGIAPGGLEDRIKISSDKYERKCAEEMASRITAWDLRNSRGDVVPITTENILRMAPQLESKMFAIMIGLEPTAICPTWNELLKQEVSAVSFDAAVNQSDVVTIRENRDAKN